MQNIKVFLLFIFGIVFLSGNGLHAQIAPRIEWQKCFGSTGSEIPTCIIRTSDGGYAFTGYTSSNDDVISGNHNLANDEMLFDVWVVKLDAFGAMEWQKCFGGYAHDYGQSIIQTHDGGYAIVGSVISEDGDVIGNHGSGDIWVLRLDPLGNLLWKRCLGGTGGDGAYSGGGGGHLLAESPDEGRGLLVAGTTGSSDGDVSGKHAGIGDSLTDIWVVKLSSSGNIQWQKCLGGSAKDEAYSVTATSDHGYVICGVTYSNDGDVIGYHKGKSISSDAWVIKLNSKGDIQWQQTLGGSAGDMVNDIIQTSDGGYAMIGTTGSTDGDLSGIRKSDSTAGTWFVKLSASGNIEKQKCFGDFANTRAWTLCQTSTFDFLIAADARHNGGDVTGFHGNADPDIWIVKFDTSLKIIWQQCYGGSKHDEMPTIILSPEESPVILGSTISLDGDVIGYHSGKRCCPSDAWLIKLGNELGVEEWHSDLKAENTLQIYPNPSESVVKLQTLSSQTVTQVEFYTIMGSRLYPEYKTENNIATVDVHNLPAGTFIARVSYFDGNGKGTLLLPLIVQH